MIVVVQRVSSASVTVADEVVGRIGGGLCLLACALTGDSDAEVDWLAHKLAHLRVFADGAGATNLSVLDVAGQALVIPQFTLAADWRKGRRPSFLAAATPEEAEARVARLCTGLAAAGVPVEEGRFGADMQVALVNSGPFTLVLDSGEAPSRRTSGGTDDGS